MIECGVTSITPRRFRSDNTRHTVDRDPEVIADVAPTHRQLNVLIVKREIDLAWTAPLAYAPKPTIGQIADLTEHQN